MTEGISGTTKLIALLGNPVAHSKSPKMHNTALKYLNLDYTYLAFEVESDQFKNAVYGLKSLGVVGFNVTMPYKQSIIPFLDELSEEAELCEAVNTVKNHHGRLIGYNTDGMGFIMSLKEQGIQVEHNKFSVIGAGGAAKSIVIQLAMQGASEIVLFNRSEQRAKHLVRIIRSRFPECSIHWREIDPLTMAVECKESEALIHTTNVGMGSEKERSLITDSTVFHKDLFVADLIYAPSKTKFLKLAEQNGCRIMNGLGMIIGQGALAFQIWTGKEMPISLVKKTLAQK